MKNITELLKMNYQEVVDYLLDKYGKINKNYFTASGNATTGIKRGSEGLYIHHIDEDKMILLSNKIGNHPVIHEGLLTEEQIRMVESDFQKADRLVYCNLLEHLLLHFKIMEYPKPLISVVKVGIDGAIKFIIPELNDIYSGIKYKAAWKQAVVRNVINLKDEYLELLKYSCDKLGIDWKKYISSFPMNKTIWDGHNNIPFFKKIKAKCE